VVLLGAKNEESSASPQISVLGFVLHDTQSDKTLAFDTALSGRVSQVTRSKFPLSVAVGSAFISLVFMTFSEGFFGDGFQQ